MMRLKNLTNRVQELKVVEFVSGREFTFYVEGNGVTDIEGFYIYDVSKLEGIFAEVTENKEIPLKIAEVVIKESLEDTKKTPEESTLVDTDSTEDIPETIIVEDNFLCDICGAEFASSRGLASHKNRVHPGE